GAVVVVVDGLLPHQYQVRLLVLDQLLEHAGDGERFEVLVRQHENRAVGTHRQPGAQLLLRRLRADAHEHHLAAGVLLLHAERFLDGDLVEGVHHPLDIVGDKAGAFGVDLELRLRIRDALHGDENLHWGSLLWGNSGTETGLRYNGGHSQSRKRVTEPGGVCRRGLEGAVPSGGDPESPCARLRLRERRRARCARTEDAERRGGLASGEPQLASRLPMSKPSRLDRSRPAFTISGASSLSMRSAWKRYAGPTMASAPTTLRV